LKKLFGKADEMEKSIQLKSLRWASAYSTAFLLVWSIYELYVREAGTLLPIILLLSHGLVALRAGLFYRLRIGKAEDEEKEEAQTEPISILTRLARINDMATPTVVSVVMIIVIIILAVRFLMGW